MKRKQIIKIHNISKILFETISIIGFLVILGTAGASDLDRITLNQTISQGLIGVCILGMGVLLTNLFGGFNND